MLYAIVWANNNPEKYGYIVFKNLLDKWRNVIAINPNEPEVLWQKSYSKLQDFKWKIDTVIFITPPNVSEKVLEDVKSLKINNVRFQPWSDNQNCIDFCSRNNITYTKDACIMYHGLTQI